MIWRRHGRHLKDGLLVSPFFALFAVFGVWPVLRSAWLSFTDYHATDDPVFIGLGNYAELFADERFMTALANTCAYMAWVSVISVLLGLALALAFGSDSPLHRAVRVAFFLPAVAGGVGAISAWKWLASSEAYGLFNSLRAALGLAPARFLGDPQWTLPVLVLVGVWSVLGYNLVIFVAGLRAIPKDLYQAAQLDGASPLNQFLHITLPNLRPTLAYVSLTGMIASFQVFYVPYLMFGAVDTLGGPLDSALMLVTYLFDRGFRHLDLGLASAAAWVLTLVLFGLTWLNLRLVGREGAR